MRSQTARVNQPEQSAALQVGGYYRRDTLTESFLRGKGHDGNRNLCRTAAENFDVEGGMQRRTDQRQQQDKNITGKSVQANLHENNPLKNNGNYTSHS